MDTKTLVKKWFDVWEKGDYQNLPITTNFVHTSPYGTIEGKKSYLNLVAANEDKFLGHRFELHEALYGVDKACVCYTAIQGDFRLDVSEWYYIRDNQIDKIVAYYNIEGEISADRQLSQP